MFGDRYDENLLLVESSDSALVSGFGTGLASDKITVDGLPVCFMYRESPRHDHDSGWRFMSGQETDEYANESNLLEPGNLLMALIFLIIAITVSIFCKLFISRNLYAWIVSCIILLLFSLGIAALYVDSGHGPSIYALIFLGGISFIIPSGVIPIIDFIVRRWH